MAYLKNCDGVNYVKYKFFIQIYNINNYFIIKVYIFIQYKFKILESFAFNLIGITKLVNYFNDFIFNIIASLGQELLQFID